MSSPNENPYHALQIEKRTCDLLDKIGALNPLNFRPLNKLGKSQCEMRYEHSIPNEDRLKQQTYQTKALTSFTTHFTLSLHYIIPTQK